jgi:hypothetical protein
VIGIAILGQFTMARLSSESSTSVRSLFLARGFSYRRGSNPRAIFLPRHK